MAFDFPNAPTVGQSFQGYTWDGEKWLQTLATPNTGGVIAIQVFTANGTYTPSANMTTAMIECVGGGAGGNGQTGSAGQNSCGGGGGAGAYARKFVTAAAIGASQPVTIGAGGSGGAGTPTVGGAGGDTSVGTICVAKGALQAAGVYNPGPGGAIAGCVGDFVTNGAYGWPGLTIPSAQGGAAGAGGASMFGAGAAPVMWSGATVTGSAAGGRGGGGSGGSIGIAGGVAGGAGAAGLVIITEYGITALGSSATSAGAVRFDLPQGLSANQQAQARSNIGVLKKNYILNGGMQINQGGYVSGAVLAAAAYGHDQWKAGTGGGDYSFTQSTGSTTITIAAGKSLIQPIEDVRVTGGGSYVLTWTGTAQARAGVNTLTPSGAYAASPLLITGQTDGTVMSVEFNTGTLGNVGLYEGTVAPPFMVPDYASELVACCRYFQKYPGALISGWQAAGSAIFVDYQFTTTMRAVPTAGLLTPVYTNSSGLGINGPQVNHTRFALTITAAGFGYVSFDLTLNARL